MNPVHLNLVVPCFNEEEVLNETIRQLLLLLDGLCARNVVNPGSCITFVDDGSRDKTWQIIEEMSRRDSRVHGIKLSCNRGHQNALLAGLLSAQGDVLVSLDADLQDDLQAIPKMVDAYYAGADIVYGVRARRDSDTFFKRTTARAYYGLLRKFDVDIVPDHADFRLMSRRALDALHTFREVNLFLRGIIPMLGFRTAVVAYDRQSRFAGESKYPLRHMLKLAFEGIFSFSSTPLKWISVIGMILSLASVGFGIWAILIRFTTNLAIPGWASTVIPMYFLGGLQLMALGIIGGYLSRIYSETKQRPRFIIEKST
jgi:polyisoprenyl-phosphate glycosyltransferase